MKNRYIVLSIVLMLALLMVIVVVLPSMDIQSQESDDSYKDQVFIEKKVSKVDIQLEESDLQDILENPTEKEVVPATVTVNGIKVQDVGFRVKGNMTLRSVAQSDSDRYSFKIDFDYYNDGQNLFGLKKLALNNSYSDSTFAREYLSYKIMDEMGIPTPANSYMYVTINGEEWGLYLGVEAIEETFLANHFEDATGDLYKPDGTGSDLKWISEDIEDYTGLGLKTNEEASNQSDMMNLLDVINNGGDLEEVMDVDEMLRYFAVNTALVNLDHYQGNMKHNYYLYEENGIFSILPWDYNMSFGGFSGGGMGPMGNRPDQQAGMPEDVEETETGSQERAGFNINIGAMMESNFMSESNINFSITEPVSGASLEERPLLNALLSNDEYRERYYDYLEEVATTYLTETNMQSWMNQVSSTILTYVEADPTKFGTTEQFLEGVSGENSLVEFAVQRSDSILKQLSGELVVEADTTSMVMPPNFENDDIQGDGQGPDEMAPSDMPEGQFPDGDNQGMMPPDMQNGQFPGGNAQDMRPPNDDGERGGDGFFPEGIGGEQTQSVDKQTLAINGICIAILIAAILFGFGFRRRRG